MKICLLTLDFPPFRSSGLTLYAESIAHGLALRGHNVTVVAASRPERDRLADSPELPDDITVIRVPTRRADWIGFGWEAAKYLRGHEGNFDIVYFVDVHFAYAYRGRFVASAFQSFRQRLTSHHGKPYYSNVGNYLFRFFYYNAARWLMEIPSLRRAQHLIMPSRSTQQEFIRYYKVEPSLATLVYPGIDFSRFTLLPSRSVARQRLRLSEDELCLLYVGFSTPRKGVEYLAQALKVMHVPASLLMVGKWEAGYQEKFLSILGDASSRVKIIGYVSDSDLLDYFAAADAFVLPTLLEGFGIPLVEAMATGLPVVTTTGGSAGEIVGDAGLIVQAGESIELAEALDRVLSDRDLACQMRTLGLERARNLFDERRTITELEAVFERALQAGTR